MQVVEIAQGTPEWLEYRAHHFNASDAPAMLGISPYKTRAALLSERQSGITPAVPPAVQARFNEGHRVEELARVFAEREILDEQLSPLVGYEGELSASFDGITFDESIVWEHKLLNNTLRKALPQRGENTLENLPQHYQAQMEQQLLVSGAEKALFMASEWSAEGSLIDERHGWYVSNPQMRQRIVRGWQEFRKDLEREPEAAPAKALKVEKDKVEALPVPQISLRGTLSADSNLSAFSIKLKEFIDGVPKEPTTDEEFVECAAAAKALCAAEKALVKVLDDGVGRVMGIAELRSEVTQLCEQSRKARLALEKLVDAEKTARKTAMLEAAQGKWQAYVAELSERIGREGFTLEVEAPNFPEVIKGLSSPESATNKISAAMLEHKTQADELAQRVTANFETLDEYWEYYFLFPDRVALVYQSEEDVAAVIEARVNDYVDAVGGDGAEEAAEDDAAEDAAEEGKDAEEVATRKKPRRVKLSKVDELGEPVIGLQQINAILYPLSFGRREIANVLNIEWDAMENRDAKWRVSKFTQICSAICNIVQSASDKIEANPACVQDIKPLPVKYPLKKKKKKNVKKAAQKAAAPEASDDLGDAEVEEDFEEQENEAE